MIKVIILLLILILFVLIGLLIYYCIQKVKKDKEEKLRIRRELLTNKGFSFKKTIIVNEKILLGLNQAGNILTYIENYDDPYQFQSYEILTKLIIKIEKINNSIKVYYLRQGEKNVLDLFPCDKETENFVYRLYKNACVEKMKEKYKENNLAITSGSNWECEYVWAFDPITSDFIYYKTFDRPSIQKFNLKKAFFTLDERFNYFETYIFGEHTQLYIYEDDFLAQVSQALLHTLKERTVEIYEDMIYFDNFSEIVYVANGKNAIRSIDLNKTNDVFYEPNRIVLTQFDEEKTIIINAQNNLVKEFEEFVMGYNLNKISKGFNYNFDKLINTTQYTKFIIDFTKNRCIYCANLNSLARFTYITIAFSNLYYVSTERLSQMPYVRITTLDNETIDVTCSKVEVADYITAQLRLILSENSQNI